MNVSDLVVLSYELLRNNHGESVTLERVRGRDGERWAIREMGACLNKKGIWEYEPMPSSRTEEFFARCRFATVEAAIACWVEKGGKSRLA